MGIKEVIANILIYILKKKAFLIAKTLLISKLCIFVIKNRVFDIGNTVLF